MADFSDFAVKKSDPYPDLDFDELLAKLTPEELEKLSDELIDPDDPCIPAANRCQYRTDKEDTGPFKRKDLLDFLEKTAMEEKDWEDPKPYAKEVRGKVWKPKEEEKIQLNDDDVTETEWDDVLQQATEEELVDLAAILGFHGMLNQIQYHQAFVEKKDASEPGSGFSALTSTAKHENFKLFEKVTPNETDVEGSLEKIKNNDAGLTVLNLNNIKNISLGRLREFADALKTNSKLEEFHMCNTRATDKVAKAFAEALKENNTLKSLSMESNYISGEGIVAMLAAINENQTVAEFRVTNQRPSILGHKIETRIADLCEKNQSLLKFGILMEIPGSRLRVLEYVQRNNDKVRKARVEKTKAAED